MLHLSNACRYDLYNGAGGMRKGFDSLAGLIASRMQHDVLRGAGFALYCTRWEKGTCEVPQSDHAEASAVMSGQQVPLILQGLSLKMVGRRKR